MKYVLLTIFILIITLVLSQVYVVKSTTDTESTNYNTLKTFEGFEIREYPELTVATTTVNRGNYNKNSRQGFGRIASYIFGGNSDNTQIAMTSPVQMDMDNDTTMSFFMPSNIKFDELPIPNNNSVRIQQMPPKIVAVVSFGGWASDEILDQKFTQLKILLSNEGIDFEDNYSYLGYNPPYQLINRKNEVLINLKNFKS